MEKPFVSIIIPCRNEEKHIGKCLDSIIANDYLKDGLEVLVIDGLSEDGTKKIIEDYSRRFPFIRLLSNPNKFTPFGLNIGIKNAKGEIIIRMDAHAIYDKDYISKCVEYLKKTGADCVGGTLQTLPSQDTFEAEVIALVLSHSFGVGGRTFRTKRKEGYVDTVPFGAYRKEIFDKIGLFNEKLVRNQDIELNSRIRKAGGKIFITPEIKLSYFAPTTFKGLISQQFQNGLWNIYTQKIAPGSLRARHFIPLFFVAGLLGSLILTPFTSLSMNLFILILGSYILLDLFFSFKISLKRGIKYLAVLPIVFFLHHFSYGLGSIFGILTFRRILK